MIFRKSIEKIEDLYTKVSLDLAEEKELEWKWGAEKNFRRNYGHRRILCFFLKLA
jgi:hypothetical protein